MSVAATFPHLQADEVRYGSLARAVPHRRHAGWKARRTAGRRPAPPPARPEGRPAAASTAPPPPLASPLTGMAELTEALERQVRAAGADMRLGQVVLGVRSIDRDVRGVSPLRYQVATPNGELDADGVILAVPAAQASALVRDLDPDLATT